MKGLLRSSQNLKLQKNSRVMATRWSSQNRKALPYVCMWMGGVPTCETEVNRWKTKSYKMIYNTGLLAMVRLTHRWKKRNTRVGSENGKVITIKTEILFWRYFQVKLPKKPFPVNCHTVMTQQRDTATYFLFLKSLPHCTPLTYDQAFWEFC